MPSGVVLDFSLSFRSWSWHNPENRGGNVSDPNEANNTGKSFFPSGAIFFFVVLLGFYALLWLVIYGLMIARS